MDKQILGVKIDGLGQAEVINILERRLRDKQPTLIFTPNPEMLVKAQNDPFFKKVLYQGTINICDGFGLWLAARLKGYKMKRLAGVECFDALAKFADSNNLKLFLLGSNDTSTIETAASNLLKIYPGLKIVGYDPGPRVVEQADGNLAYAKSDNDALLNKINQSKADILAVGFGMGKQEKWIVENMGKLEHVKVAIGVGGTFDYLSGRVKRAPLLMRKFGLEWLYRLGRQPARFSRIFNATVKFVYLFLTS